MGTFSLIGNLENKKTACIAITITLQAG